MIKNKLIIVGMIVIVVITIGVFLYVNRPPKYNLIFYYTDTFYGRISPFYLLDTHDFSKREITIEEIENLDLITEDVSPDELKIVLRPVPPGLIERILPEIEIGGIFEFEVLLYRSFLRKGLIGTVDKPHGDIGMKGWVIR